MPCNHWGPLHDLHSGKPLPMVPVGDFNLVDKIFPGTPGNSLLFNGDELTKLQKRGTKSPPTRRRSCLLLAPRRKNLHPPAAQEMRPVQPARRGNLLSPAGELFRLPHRGCQQTHLAGSLHATANTPLHLRSSVTSVKRTHTVCPSSTRTSLTVTGAAKTKKVTSPHGCAPCLCPNGHLPLKGQGRSPTLRSLPGL